MSKYKDLVAGAIGMLFSAALFYMSVQIGLKEKTSIGADFLPKIVAVIMFVLFTVVFVRGIKEAKSGNLKNNQDYKSNYFGVAIAFSAMLAYAYFLKKVGFIITSVLFLILSILLMTKRDEQKPLKALAISIIAVLVIYYIFSGFFGIRLPKGIL